MCGWGGHDDEDIPEEDLAAAVERLLAPSVGGGAAPMAAAAIGTRPTAPTAGGAGGRSMTPHTRCGSTTR